MDQKVEPVVGIPLVVDLDGTLVKVDTLHEALVRFSATKPLHALRALMMLKHGRAAFKAAVADHMLPDVDTLPVNEQVLDAIQQARKEGRKVYLATAADRRFADAVANAIGGFDGVFASQHQVNLKGQSKADCLVSAFGLRGFDYIGNDDDDVPVWRAARLALIAAPHSRKLRRVISEVPGMVPLASSERSASAYLFALRPHQWLKNALLALPVFAAHDFSAASLIIMLIAFASFSFGASSIYLVNDMLDLANDRAHPEKRYRALAAGHVPLSHGVVMLGILAALSIGLALALPPPFILVLFGYFGLSTAYSLYLKRKLMIDVVALAGLYGVRVLAGGAATGVVLSHWLVGFCFFIFLSLALVKRLAELLIIEPTSAGNVRGRGYRREDIQTMTTCAVASGFVAVLVLALYINSPEVVALYRHPELLWGICVVLVYWLGRVYFLTGRGEMDQDPVIFAVTDGVSLLTGIVVLFVFLVAL